MNVDIPLKILRRVIYGSSIGYQYKQYTWYWIPTSVVDRINITIFVLENL